MAGKNNAYNNLKSNNHNSNIDKSECTSVDKTERYSQELEISKKKKIKITLEFPYTVDPKDADRFEHMLKSIYLNKMKTGSLQSGLSAVPFPSPKGKCEASSHEKQVHKEE